MTHRLAADMSDPAFLADPVAGFDRLRDQAPVVQGRGLDGRPTWLVTSHDDVRAALTDPRLVNSPPAALPADDQTLDAQNLDAPAGAVGAGGADAGGGAGRDALLAAMGVPRHLLPYVNRSIINLDGADHARLRRIVIRAFTARRVDALRPRVEAIASDLLDRMGDTADLIEEYAYPLPIAVICELVGIPEEDRGLWRSAAATLTSLLTDSGPVAVQALVDRAHELVALRRGEPRDDLVSELVTATDSAGDPLSDVEIVTMVLSLATAGHETTANLVGNGIAALLTHPDQLQVLRDRPELWPDAVREVVRWDTSILVTEQRYASAELTLGGRLVAAGDTVQPVLSAANHDPAAYPDPGRFDVTRPRPPRGDGHLGFGLGRHYCLGAGLAKQEAEVALRAVFERFPDLALQAEELAWIPNPAMRQLAALSVRTRP